MISTNYSEVHKRLRETSACSHRESGDEIHETF